MRKKLVQTCLLAMLACGISIYHGEQVEAKTSKYANMVIADVDNKLNVREKASTNSKVVGQMTRGSVGTIIKKGSQWTKIQSGKVTGYVSNDYVLSGNAMAKFAKENIKGKDATVTTDVLNVRAKKSTGSKVLGKVTKGQKFAVKSVAKKWTKITYKKAAGYVSNDYVDVDYHFTVATAIKSSDEEITVSDNQTDVVGNSSQDFKEEDSSSSNGNTSVNKKELRKELVSYALQFVGNPYVYGGTSLTQGADCSGFIQTIYSKFGISLNRVSYEQATNGRQIALSEIQPGDLVFYIGSGSSRISHVSIYIGNNQVVHALNSTKGICVSNLYYNTPHTIRNVID